MILTFNFIGKTQFELNQFMTLFTSEGSDLPRNRLSSVMHCTTSHDVTQMKKNLKITRL